MEENPIQILNSSQPLGQETKTDKTFLRPLEDKKSSNLGKTIGFVLGIIIIIGAGIFTGQWLAGGKGAVSLTGGGTPKVIKSDKVVGSTDNKTFRDSAEGVLEKGGIDAEGSHHLVRDPKRPDQNAYLTSSVIDLDQYVGKKVKVWGETFTAQKAGWLMDVGKIEVLD